MMGLKHQQSQETLWLTADHLVLAKLRPRTLGGNRDWSASPYYNLQNRKRLRQDMTPPERKLWAYLQGKQLGYKFRRQHPIGRYIADFYSRDANLVVEVDGATHFTPEAITYDQERDRYMRHLGLAVLRFTTQEVETNLDEVCLTIQSHCQIRTQSIEDARWIQAGALQPGDVVFTICPPLNPPVDGGTSEPVLAPSPWIGSISEPIPAPSPSTGRAGEGATPGIGKGVILTEVQSEYSEETVYDLEVEGAHSFVTNVCIVHNCGSGTTAYVTEPWGRRWIMIDTSRVALARGRISRCLPSPIRRSRIQTKSSIQPKLYIRKPMNPRDRASTSPKPQDSP
jgi:very-short-patch-repair endonuclease